VYGLPTGDWNTIIAAAVVMCAVAVAASIVPARRALKLSPNDALRID
jgi:ABC-type antimicrobial peptide transport system permease subunit